MKTKLSVLKWLLSYVKLLRGKMLVAIFLGSLSFLVVISIPLIGTLGVLQFIQTPSQSLLPYVIAMIACGIARGVFRYTEQYLNHDIAFRLLALIRDKVFGVLRTLAPAKLQGKKSGDLIALITSDVEALEVFFAHTVSPVGIALLVSALMSLLVATIDWRLGLIALLAYIMIGVVIPYLNYRQNQALGDTYKEAFAELNQTVIEGIGASQEVKSYHLSSQLLKQLQQAGEKVNQQQRRIISQGTRIQNLSEVAILFFSVTMFWVSVALNLSFSQILLATMIMLSTFGPVLALSGLGNALLTTFASAERIYQLIHETPAVTEITTGQELTYTGATFQHVTFNYPTSDQAVLNNVSLTLPETGILGVKGPSGVGKSTFLKLVMRFWQTDQGQISFGQTDINNIKTSSLRSQQGYMEQDTFLFEATLAENITLGQESNAQQLQQAIEKAALSEWLANLPDGLNTLIGGKHRQLSDGEKQRLALARIFYYDPALLLLDEPTSNLDYLNERIILNVLLKEQDKKAIILVSHRETSLTVADTLVEFNSLNH